MKRYYGYPHNRVRKMTIPILFCSFFCALLYVLFFNLQTLQLQFISADWHNHDEQLKKLSKQLAALETNVEEKKQIMPVLYNELLRTQGKLKYPTIVLENDSRLNIADVSLRSPNEFSRFQTDVSRHAAARYSAATFDVTTTSAATAFELNQAFTGTPLSGLGEAFIRAEEENGINAIFLAALAVVESDWGASILARENNNLFGFGAYTSSPDSAVAFSSKADCIFYVASFFRDHYIEGSYYRGRFITDINKLYAADPNWSNKVFSAMLRINDRIQKNSM